MIFNNYPYTDFHEMNLDFILKRISELDDAMDTFVKFNTIKYAEPLLWSIAKQYEKNTIVQDANGVTYLSKKEVPVNITLENTDYWLKVADFTALADDLRKSIAIANDGSSATSSKNRNVGDLIWLNGFLYRVVREIMQGDAYVFSENNNVEKITIEDLIKNIYYPENELLEIIGIIRISNTGGLI